METAALRPSTGREYASGGGKLGVVAELLLPPLGLAAPELGLRLRDEGRELAFLVAQPLLELGQRRLALLELVRSDLDVRIQACLADLAVGPALPRRDLRLALVQLRFARGQLELAPVQLRGVGHRFLGDPALVRELALEALGFVAEPILLDHQLRLALADHLVLGGEAGPFLLQVSLPRRQLALALRELLLLRAKIGLALVHLALVAHLPLAILELDLELGELRLARVEGGRAVGELLLRAHAAVVGSALLVEAAAESGLASLRGLELRLERAELRARGDRFAV